MSCSGKPYKRLTSPGEHRFGVGWMLGNLDGQIAFCDGCAAFVGKPPKGKTCNLKNGMLAGALRKARLKKLIPTEFLREESNGGYDLVILKGNVAIQKEYYDFLLKRFPKAGLYLGKKTPDRESRYVLGLDQKKIVSLICPIRVGR